MVRQEGNSDWFLTLSLFLKIQNPNRNYPGSKYLKIWCRKLLNDGQPDFSPTSKGTVEIENFSTERDDNFDAKRAAIAKKGAGQSWC